MNLKNIHSFHELLTLIHKSKSTDNFIPTTFGYQFSISIHDYKIPIRKISDFPPILNDLLNDLVTKSGRYYKLWRQFNTRNDQKTDVDQLIEVINTIETNPTDRRMLLTAWNPLDKDNSSNTHCLMQFNVKNGSLSSKLYQSKGQLSEVMRYDSGKAVLLTLVLCHITGLQPGSFVHTFGELELDIGIENIEETSPNFCRVEIIDGIEKLEELSEKNFRIEEDKDEEIAAGLLQQSLGGCNSPAEIASRTERERPRRHEEHEEHEYLGLMREIIENGARVVDRTLVGTVSVFGPQMVFSLRDNVLPLITTKRVFLRGIVEELLWFVRGSTDSDLLAEKNVHIWDANASKEFLESRGLGHREQGDLGPVYGFQWRHFGAEYRDKRTDYSGEGFDQLGTVIRSIRESPDTGTHLVVAWNPRDVPLMALPPCHCLMQFHVDRATNELSCKLYQRSGDMGLGVPFNIASYAILTRMIAHVTGHRPGTLIHSLGDAHVYLNHVDAVSAQIKREPRPFPRLKFRRSVTDIEDFRYEDFIIEDYNPHPKISMEMAV